MTSAVISDLSKVVHCIISSFGEQLFLWSPYASPTPGYEYISPSGEAVNSYEMVLRHVISVSGGATGRNIS